MLSSSTIELVIDGGLGCTDIHTYLRKIKHNEIVGAIMENIVHFEKNAVSRGFFLIIDMIN